MSSISPLYYFQTSTDNYFISPITNYDYISEYSSYKIIGLNNDRKAIIKFNSRFFHIYKDPNDSIFKAGYASYDFTNFDSSTTKIPIYSYKGYYLTKIQNNKLLISLCDINSNKITIKYILINQNVIKELEYSTNPNKINNPDIHSCDKIQTVEIKINENSYIISCYFVKDYGVTCISNLIKEKMIISNKERIIGLCNNITTQPNTFTLLSNDTFAMIGCGSEDAKIVKIDENLNEIGNQILFEHNPETILTFEEKMINFDFFLNKDNKKLVFVYLTYNSNNNNYKTYYQEYYIPICENSEKFWAQNITYDFKFLINDYNNPQETYIKFLSNPNYMKTLHPECKIKGCEITNANPLYLYGSDNYLDSLNYTIEYILVQKEL